MLYTHIFGQLCFQSTDLRSHNIGTARHGLQDGLVHVLLEDLILLFEISELHRFFRYTQNDSRNYGFAFARPIEKQATT